MPLRWQTVLILAAVAGINYADRTSLSVVYPLLQAELHLSDMQLAAIGSFFLWSYALGSLVAGLLADRLPRNRVIFWSLLAWSLVTIVSGLARSANELLATRVVLGLAECFYLPAAVALIADHHPVESRGRALSLHMSGLYAGLVGGAALSGYLGETYGWRMALFALGGAGIFLAAICQVWLREAPREEGFARETASLGVQVRGLLKQRGYLLLAGQAMLIAVGTWMFFNWMPLYFRETFGMSLAMAGLSGTALLQVSAVAGYFAGGVLSDRAALKANDGRLKLMSLCYLLCAPCLLIFLTGGGVMVVGGGVVLFSFLRSIAASNETAALCDLIASRDRATAQSLMNTLNTLAGGAGVFVGVGVLVVMAAVLVSMARPVDERAG
jgi:predicted MFS family arabinose efflux permease